MNKLHYSIHSTDLSIETINEVVDRLNEDGKSIDSVQVAEVKNYEKGLEQYTLWNHMTIFTEDYLTSDYFMNTMFEKTSLDMSGRFIFYNDNDELEWLET